MHVTALLEYIDLQHNCQWLAIIHIMQFLRTCDETYALTKVNEDGDFPTHVT